MAQGTGQFSSGLPGFDRIIGELRPGDNLVWQVDSVEDFEPFAEAYCQNALAGGRELIYFRFGEHAPFLTDSRGARIINLNPDDGFEIFTTLVHDVINSFGKGHYYIFDLLSELAVHWLNDRMLGNFFMQTCPYLYDAQTITTFVILRNFHSFHATRPIVETAQIVINVYRHKGSYYVHPIKVQGRYSPTMNMIHLWKGDEFVPVRESCEITDILKSVTWFELDSANERHGFWARTFAQAEHIRQEYQKGLCSIDKVNDCFGRLLRMIISTDERILNLADTYLNLQDLIEIRKRMIGTGLIGGKSVGMLLARAIIAKEEKQCADLLEPHDSFFIGSDVFYTYLVQNKVWWLRQKQRNDPDFLEGAEEGRKRILDGKFPEYIEKQFINMLDYFGQCPIIVRSSSLLEDNFGNAFAGKYESFFCTNQGPREQRLEEFTTAVKKIYASSMSEEALTYRAKRGLLQRDEPMALLVQRVSGSVHQQFFFPHCAGVGFSYNPYVWSQYIDPEAGMLRLVFGLGTRAVDQNVDDYTRIVALNDPARRPETRLDDAKKFAQKRVDLLDLAAGEFASKDFEDVLNKCDSTTLDLLVSRDIKAEKRAEQLGLKDFISQTLTFERLLTKTTFPEVMRRILSVIQKAYRTPVDIEFTTNCLSGGSYRINLLQCRPLQLKEGGPIGTPPPQIDQKDMIINARGPVVGKSRLVEIATTVFVVPQAYSKLPVKDRYAVAKLIGKITHDQRVLNVGNIMLIGPGRWGTSTPSLGVPVSYQEINTVGILVEAAVMGNDISPDISLGTHFFSDLIESDTIYLALLPRRKDTFMCDKFFLDSDNQLDELFPEMKGFSNIVRVINSESVTENGVVMLYANSLDHKFVCYIRR
ncbi:MAG: PEP/pyruvate-binding domain-containing protein [Planctomycetota bacterium]